MIGAEGFVPPEGPGTNRADIYSLGKVRYEISTGKDRNEFPVVPAEMSNHAQGGDMALLNTIILKACRQKAWQRFQTTGEMMLALLSFQFNKDSLRKPEISQLQTKAVAVVGGAVATAILIGVMWRIVWLIRQGP